MSNIRKLPSSVLDPVKLLHNLGKSNFPAVEIAIRHLNQFPKEHHLFKAAQAFMSSNSEAAFDVKHTEKKLVNNHTHYTAYHIPKLLDRNKLSVNVHDVIFKYFTNTDLSVLGLSSFSMHQVISSHSRFIHLLYAPISQGLYLADLLNATHEKSLTMQGRVADVISNLQQKGIRNFQTIYCRFNQLYEISKIHTLNEAQMIALSGNVKVIAEWLPSQKNYYLDFQRGHLLFYLALSGKTAALELLLRQKLDLQATDMMGNNALHYAAFSGIKSAKKKLLNLGLENKANYFAHTPKFYKKLASEPPKRSEPRIEMKMQPFRMQAGLIFKMNKDFDLQTAFESDHQIVHYAGFCESPMAILLLRILGLSLEEENLLGERLYDLIHANDNPVMRVLVDSMTYYNSNSNVFFSKSIWDKYSSHLFRTQLSCFLDYVSQKEESLKKLMLEMITPLSPLIDIYFNLAYLMIFVLLTKKMLVSDEIVSYVAFAINEVIKKIRKDQVCLILQTTSEGSTAPVLYYEQLGLKYYSKLSSFPFDENSFYPREKLSILLDSLKSVDPANENTILDWITKINESETYVGKLSL